MTVNKREDALKYNKAQLRRARINLIKADKRGDKRAVKKHSSQNLNLFVCNSCFGGFR